MDSNHIIIEPPSSAFSKVSVVSSTEGAAVILPDILSLNGAEEWTVTLRFDPAVDGAGTDTLQITSDDLDESAVSVSLSGTGVKPSVNMTSPQNALNVNAGQMYSIQ